jgi:anaphase-promoting complex subunit 5
VLANAESSDSRRRILLSPKEFEKLLSTYPSAPANAESYGRRRILVSLKEFEKFINKHPLADAESSDGRRTLDFPKEPESSDSRQSILDSPKEFEKFLSAHPSASAMPGRSLWDLLLKRLWDIDSLDALHIFFERLSHLLAKSRENARKDSEMGIPPTSPEMIVLSRASPLGTFVLQSQLEFTRLKFHDALELWKSFVAYRHVTLPYWKKRNPRADSWNFDTVLQMDFGKQRDDSLESSVIQRDLGRDDSLRFDTAFQRDRGDDSIERLTGIVYGDIFRPEGAPGLVSTDDMQKLLEFQIEQMQSEMAHVPLQQLN